MPEEESADHVTIRHV